MDGLKNRLGEEKHGKVKEIFAGSMCNGEITEHGFVHWMVNNFLSNAFRLKLRTIKEESSVLAA